jgi:hypothetical protein
MTKRTVAAMIVLGLAGMLIVGNAACQPGPPAEQGTAATCPAPLLAPPSAKTQQLAEDIRLLQLVNRMQFTPAQIQSILPLVDALAVKRAQFDQEAAAVDQRLESALGDERALLMADKPITAEVQKQVNTLQSERVATQQRAQTEIAQGAAALRKVFTAPQLAIVTGSYEAQLQARELLEWLRTLADNDFSEEAQANAEGLAVPEKGLDTQLLLNLFNTARKLSAADFARQEDELAQSLAPAYGLSEAEANGRIAGAFGSARMPALLREKATVSQAGAG